MSLRFSGWQQLIVTQSALENQSGTSQLARAITLKLVICIPALIFSQTSSTNREMIKIRASVVTFFFLCQVVPCGGLAAVRHAGGLFAVFRVESQPGREQTPAAGSGERRGPL